MRSGKCNSSKMKKIPFLQKELDLLPDVLQALADLNQAPGSTKTMIVNQVKANAIVLRKRIPKRIKLLVTNSLGQAIDLGVVAYKARRYKLSRNVTPKTSTKQFKKRKPAKKEETITYIQRPLNRRSQTSNKKNSNRGSASKVNSNRIDRSRPRHRTFKKSVRNRKPTPYPSRRNHEHK